MRLLFTLVLLISIFRLSLGQKVNSLNDGLYTFSDSSFNLSIDITDDQYEFMFNGTSPTFIGHSYTGNSMYRYDPIIRTGQGKITFNDSLLFLNFETYNNKVFASDQIDKFETTNDSVTIKITAIDSGTNDTIIGAIINFINEDSWFYSGYVTNLSGKCALRFKKSSSTKRLKLSMIAFLDYEILLDLNYDQEITVHLMPDPKPVYIENVLWDYKVLEVYNDSILLYWKKPGVPIYSDKRTFMFKKQ